MNQPKKNPLVVLGFEPNARPDQDELKKAHRKATKKYYLPSQQGDEEATKKLAEVNAAYEYLTKGPGAKQTVGGSMGESIADFIKREQQKRKAQDDNKNAASEKTDNDSARNDEDKQSHREALEEGFTAFLEAVQQLKPRFEDLKNGGGALFNKALDMASRGPQAPESLKKQARKVSGYLASGDIEKRLGQNEAGKRVSGLVTSFGKALDKRLNGRDDDNGNDHDKGQGPGNGPRKGGPGGM